MSARGRYFGHEDYLVAGNWRFEVEGFSRDASLIAASFRVLPRSAAAFPGGRREREKSLQAP